MPLKILLLILAVGVPGIMTELSCGSEFHSYVNQTQRQKEDKQFTLPFSCLDLKVRARKPGTRDEDWHALGTLLSPLFTNQYPGYPGWVMGSAPGDSGDPLVVPSEVHAEHTLVGIVSYGMKDPRTIEVLTRVSAYVQFIQETIKS